MSPDEHPVQTIQIDSAKIVWTDDEVGTTLDVPVNLLPNGWIHTPKTDCYYPPGEIVEVERVD